MKSRLGAATALLAVEILLIFIVFQILVSFECRATDYETACRGLRSAVVRGMAILAATAFAYRLRPAAFEVLLQASRDRARRHWALLLNLIGVATVLLPLVIYGPDRIGVAFGQVFWFLLIGGLLSACAALVWAVPVRAWAGWLAGPARPMVPLLVAAALIPDLAVLLEPGWQAGALSTATFAAVHALLLLLGQEVVIEPARSIIGTGGFNVLIGKPCAGLEGFALVLAFTAIYAILMRGKVRQRRLWFAVLPLALLASWLLNVVRITTLILIGAHISPEHAVNGFHSFAGWLFFTILVFVLLVVMERLSWLHHGTRVAPESGLGDDWLAARILPFAAFMFSGVVTSAFWAEPALAYPIRAAVLVGALVYFRRSILAIRWRLDPVALVAGIAVGVAWVAAVTHAGPPDDGLLQALGQLAPPLFLVWAVIRTLSTVLLVPVVEELFFRGYILERLDSGGRLRTVFAILVSTSLFALFHGYWLVAALAGLVFCLVTLRSGRLADAIVSHMAANLMVALWAVVTDQWWVI